MKDSKVIQISATQGVDGRPCVFVLRENGAVELHGPGNYPIMTVIEADEILEAIDNAK